jgi:hypothetical protein
VSKTVHREATWLFYTHNRFFFIFLRQISQDYADCIRHIVIGFVRPTLDNGAVALNAVYIRTLAGIKSSCSSLKMLTVFLRCGYVMPDGIKLDPRAESNEVLIEVLNLLDTHFRAISSLRDIKIQFNGDEEGPSDLMRREMENRGWTVSISKPTVGRCRFRIVV